MENKIIKNKVSIIIPLYNSEKTIIESIQSVVNEAISSPYDWELVIVNDGSTDQSPNCVNEYITNSSFQDKIRIITQINGGAAKARNTGIRESNGEYIAFNDSDDCWLSGKLELQMNYLSENKDVVLVGGTFGQDNVETLKKIEYETHITIKDQVLKNYFTPQAVILRRRILEKSGLFSEKMRFAEEGFFFNNIVVKGKCILLNKVVTAPITSKERYGDSGLSGNLLEMEKGELFNIRSAYRFGYISLSLFLVAYIFSIIKFLRRVLFVKFNLKR